MHLIWVTVFLLAVVACEAKGEDVEWPKHAYTMVDYICHKQPHLSICSKRSLRASVQTPRASVQTKNAVEPYDSDPMPTPGPLPLGDLKSTYSVAREQEEPSDTDKRLDEEKAIRTRTKVDDEDMLKPVEGDTAETSESTTNEITTTTEEQLTTSPPPKQTLRPINPHMRYQQYERALQERYRSYPNYQQYGHIYPNFQQQDSQNYPNFQQQYYGEQRPGFYSSYQQYYPQQNRPDYYQQQGQQEYYQQQGQQYYQSYPQQQGQQYYGNYQQPNYYQPNGFNFGIGSQLQIPFAGPLGISTGFEFGG